MENKILPKVLVVSTNAWRDNTGINTLIKFFECWDNKRIAQIYTKSVLPKTSVCKNFFRISENAVLKSLFNRKITTGQIVENETEILEQEVKVSQQENKIYSQKTKRFSFVLSYCREIVWKLGKWKTKELDKFIENFDADVLFIPIYPTIYMGRIQKYIIKKANKPVVSYLADDNYTFQNIKKTPLALISRLILRKYVKFIVENSDKLLVIAPKQKEEYDKIFNIDSDVLTKGIDFSKFPFTDNPISKPIKMVYTGKLIIGRWKSLAAIAESMGKINAAETKVELDIYTTDILTKEQEKLLNRNGCKVKGALSLEEVIEVQKQADILVFVESLEKKYKNIARLSFSTKITDYLSSGKCIFAVGDKEIAPIDYFNRFDSAVTASSYDEIDNKLSDLVNNPDKIYEYSKKAYECGVEKHSIEKMDNILISTICNAVK